MNVNLLGVINSIYYFLPIFKRNNSGRICIISSVGGQIGLWGMSHYCATKFALKGMTHTLIIHPNLGFRISRRTRNGINNF